MLSSRLVTLTAHHALESCSKAFTSQLIILGALENRNLQLSAEYQIHELMSAGFIQLQNCNIDGDKDDGDADDDNNPIMLKFIFSHQPLAFLLHRNLVHPASMAACQYWLLRR